MTPVLEVDSLVKQYPKHRALDGVSLRIEAGEIFALLGPNGAGKTTLIGAVCGLVKKTSGTVKLFGTDLDKDAISPRFHVGLVPQEINFDPFFNVREMLSIQQGYFGQKRDDARIDEVLAAMALSDKADVPTRALSGGMKRRLLIAKALVHRPKLVFLDEPTAGVDVELRRDLWNYVRKLRSEGTTVVLTTHYLEEAEELADRVGIINKGKLLLLEEKSALMRRLGERVLTVRFSSAVTTLPANVQGTLSTDGLRLDFIERHGTQTAASVLAAAFASGLPVNDVSMAPAKLEDILLRVLNGTGALAGNSPAASAGERDDSKRSGESAAEKATKKSGALAGNSPAASAGERDDSKRSGESAAEKATKKTGALEGNSPADSAGERDDMKRSGESAAEKATKKTGGAA